jgi:hypothetical protein
VFKIAKNCPHCNATNNDKATFCSSCGLSFSQKTAKQTRKQVKASPPQTVTQQQVKKTNWSFPVSFIAGILIIANAVGLLFNSFYNSIAGLYPWLLSYAPFPPWTLVTLGVAVGILAIIGSFLILRKYRSIGTVILFSAAVISLSFGGGFILGFILGIIGIILMILEK